MSDNGEVGFSLEFDNEPKQEETIEIFNNEGEAPNEEQSEVIGDINEEKSEVEKETVSKTTSSISDVAKALLGESTLIDIIGEDGEVEQVSIDDIDLTPQMLKEILDTEKERIVKEASEDKISVKGLSEVSMSIINTLVNGGDVSNLIKFQEEFVKPISELDLTKKEDQIQAIYLRYKSDQDSDDDIIDDIIAGAEAKGTLAQRAEIAVQELQEAIATKAVKMEEDARSQQEHLSKMMNQYKEDLSENIKKELGLADKIVRNLVDFASVKIDDGSDNSGFHKVDIEYRRRRSDPTLASELMLFLYDTELYKKKIREEIKVEEAVKHQRSVRLSNTALTSSTDEKIGRGGNISLEF